MFKQWVEKMLRNFSGENPDGHPSVLKGHALILDTQLRGLTMTCHANTLKPEKRPGLRYAVNPILCTSCKVVHSRLDDSSLYTTATEDCWTFPSHLFASYSTVASSCSRYHPLSTAQACAGSP